MGVLNERRLDPDLVRIHGLGCKNIQIKQSKNITWFLEGLKKKKVSSVRHVQYLMVNQNLHMHSKMHSCFIIPRNLGV